MPRRVEPSITEPIGLGPVDAGALCGVSRFTWDEMWKAGLAPQPARNPGSKSRTRWSRDELRAWMAHGCPPVERWARIWRKMLDSGTWCPTRLISKEDGNAA